MKIFGQLEKAQLENLTVDPTGTGLVPGVVWYRTDQKLFKVYDGTVVQTFVDLNTAQTLSNKILASPELTGAITFNQTTTPTTPAVGKNKFYYKTDGLLYTLDSAGNEALVGSGAEGGGATNLISNGSAESTAVSIFVPYADTAGTRPVDGIGGSPTVTTAINTSNPLIKNKDFTLIKPASNCQGQGWAISNIALPLAYRGKSIKSFLEYLVNSGTFVPGTTGGTPTDGDLIAYFYDQTNSKLMEPSNIKFLGSSTTISDKYEGTVQFDINCTQVRMILHIASTSALAWTLQVDNVTLSPQNYVYGTPVTDFGLPIVHTTNVTTNATLTTRTRRVGDSYHVSGNIVFSGANTQAITPTIVLPYVIDGSKIPNSGTVAVGQYSIQNAGSGAVSSGSMVARLSSFGGSAVVFEGVSPSTNVPFTIAAGHSFGFEFTVPVVGLSSSAQMSDGYDSRKLGIKQAGFVASTPTNNIIIFPSVEYADGLTVSGGRVTIPSADLYDIESYIGSAVNIEYYIWVNGVTRELLMFTDASGRAQGSTSLYLKAGDIVDLRPGSATGGMSAYSRFSINRRQGPQTIAASEKITAQATYGAGLALTAGTPIPYATRIFDTHGTITTGAGAKWTAPRAGFATIRISSGSNSTVNYQVFKNGSIYSASPYLVATTVAGGVGNGTKKIPVISGDFLQIVPDSNSTSQVIGDFEITLD